MEWTTRVIVLALAVASFMRVDQIVISVLASGSLMNTRGIRQP